MSWYVANVCIHTETSMIEMGYVKIADRRIVVLGPQSELQPKELIG